MKHTVVALAFVLAASTGMVAAGDADAVVAAHKKLFETQASCNAEAMAPLVADDMQFLHAGGMIENKAAYLKSTAACPLSQLTSEVMNTRIYGDTGIVTGKLTYKTKAGPGGDLFFTEVFVKRNGAWTFVSHQSTVPSAPPAKK